MVKVTVHLEQEYAISMESRESTRDAVWTVVRSEISYELGNKVPHLTDNTGRRYYYRAALATLARRWNQKMEKWLTHNASHCIIHDWENHEGELKVSPYV